MEAKSYLPKTRSLSNGMGKAVAKRTVYRDSDGESWARVATRVALGNLSLVDKKFQDEDEYIRLRAAIASGALLTSGRHLQHGDKNQANKPMELHSNCSSAATSFLLFLLLLCGSGVGRSYDDALMLVDWANAPELAIVLDYSHQDYPKTEATAREFLATIYGEDNWVVKNDPLCLLYGVLHTKAPLSTKETTIFKVPDSREGWATALEVFESMAYRVVDRDKLLVLDLSEVRPLGTPIGGMQSRPASGPLSLARGFLNALKVIAKAKQGKLPLWHQAMLIDHYFAQEVQVGGARRSARLSSKDWKDPDIIDFIKCKNDYGMWTSNNSITVDAEFWEGAKVHGTRANGIFLEATENSFIAGEPGFLNGDRLEDAVTGSDREKPIITSMGSNTYKVTKGLSLLKSISQIAAGHRQILVDFKTCVSGETLILTSEGLKTARSLVGVPFVAIVNGTQYQASGFWWAGNRYVYEIKTDNGTEVKTTFDHEIMTEGGWSPVSLLREGSKLMLPADDGINRYTKVISITPIGSEDVFDCRVPGPECFVGNGLILHNCSVKKARFATTVNPCGEIPLHVTGGYCVLFCVAPLLACPVPFKSVKPEDYKLWDSLVLETVRLAARSALRVNIMDSIYKEEVARSQRIGVGLTGVHEYAWVRFGLTWADLVDEEKSQEFWAFIETMSFFAKQEANTYALEMGLNIPITVTDVPPGGTISKLFGLTEGIHLPSRRQYIRWVQFRGYRLPDGTWEPTSDQLLPEYETAGYPIRELKTFPGMSIVGFPTKPTITRLGMGSKLVTAKEATPADQYKWLQLIEKYWLGPSQGGQASYTLKIDTSEHTLEAYREIVLNNQPKIRCCSILPIKPDSQLGYEYLPEEEVPEADYELCVKRITGHVEEDIDIEALICENGACPL